MLKAVTAKRRTIPRLVTLDLAERRSLRERWAPAVPFALGKASDMPDFLAAPVKRLEEAGRDILGTD